MGTTAVRELDAFGQSVWLDFLSRSLTRSGRLRSLIDLGLAGLTSNPTIFDHAIGAGPEYDDEIRALRRGGASVFEIYDGLTIGDVGDAADELRPVFDRTAGRDGYASLEIDPRLADDAERTIAEGRRLAGRVGRPNVMFKVPATEAGFAAIEELTAAGINVNVTLIFSPGQYRRAAESYIRGIERLIAAAGDPRRVRSVASVFVSRIDTAVDAALDGIIAGDPDPGRRALAVSLRGRAAAANAHVCYSIFRRTFAADGFRGPAARGAAVQRPLWGSTSTKDPAYSDVKYVEELIAKDTVNTMPEKTFQAFLDHGRVAEALTADASRSEETLAAVGRLGISMDAVCARLLEDGVKAFDRSLEDLLATIERKAGRL